MIYFIRGDGWEWIFVEGFVIEDDGGFGFEDDVNEVFV